MNVVLIGYRGTGKSTVGQLLANRLGRVVISTDAEIARREGRSIPDIVAQHGWEYFRDVETAVCQEIGDRDHVIVDTGGGAILRAQNVQALKKKGRLFWLTAEVKTIVERIGGDHQRPSLTGTKSFTDEVEEVLRERLPKYQAAADYTIETDGQSTTVIADRLLALLPNAAVA